MSSNGLFEKICCNAFLLAISSRLDLGVIIPDIHHSIQKNQHYESGIAVAGLDMIYQLAARLNVSPAEILELSEEKKQAILRDFLYIIKTKGRVMEIQTEGLPADKRAVIQILVDMNLFQNEHSFQSEYLLECVKTDHEYQLFILTTNILRDPLFPKRIRLWSEEKGNLSRHIENEYLRKPEEFQPTSSHRDELVRVVDEFTRTTEIFDQFRRRQYTGYKRIVVENGIQLNDEDFSDRIYGHLVIERPGYVRPVGDITMTQFKQGGNWKFFRHIQKETEGIDQEDYLDRDVFYRFREPYHLRAQDSVTYQTIYTHDYIFAGMYLSSSFRYDSFRRIHRDRREQREDPRKVKARYHTLFTDLPEFEFSEEKYEAEFDDVSEPEELAETEIPDEPEPEAETDILDLDVLKETSDQNLTVSDGDQVEYKNLQTDQIRKATIQSETYPLHKRFLGSRIGDMVGFHNKFYVITDIQK